MSASTSRSGSGHRAKAQSISGWTAFDLKQRRKQQGLEAAATAAAADNHDSEPYPSLSALTHPQSLFNKNGSLIDKPFSSVVVPSVKDTNFPSQLPTSNSSLGSQIQNVDTINAYEKLKNLQPWADESLIQDVLSGVNNNVDEALSLLEAMAISEDEEVGNKKKVDSTYNDFAPPDISLWVKEDMISFINQSLGGNHKQSEDEESSIRLLDTIKSLPIESEPEWGEDDVYLIYRKDAIRMIRSASHHSKSANDAYVRGDHAAARHFSHKAQQEWTAAERLNAKAANEILNVRNCRNDLWTLDLHGLHAAEAVEALRKRLKSVESIVSQNFLGASGMSVAASVQSTSQLEMEKFGGQQSQHLTSRPRMTLLQVITGKGNHSRGSAALPSAIRNFLSENRYHFDETRPGVIMVRSKFRLQ